MKLLTLLTDTPIALQRYAIDGAMYSDKVCRRKCIEGRSSSIYYTKYVRGRSSFTYYVKCTREATYSVTVTNEQDGGSSSSYLSE